MHFLILVFSFLNLNSVDSVDPTDVFLDLQFHSIQGGCFTDAQGNPAQNGATQTYKIGFLAELGNNSIIIQDIRLDIPKSQRGTGAQALPPYASNGEYFIDFLGCGSPTLVVDAIVAGQEITFRSTPIPLNTYCC